MSQYRYRISMERVPGADGQIRGEASDQLSFEADNHDDLFHIVRRQRSKGIWSEDEAASLAVGLKLFGEVALHHRNDPLFEPMMLPLREFIGRLKALPEQAE